MPVASPEQPLELPGADAEPSGICVDRQGRAEVLFHQQQGPADAVVDDAPPPGSLGSAAEAGSAPWASLSISMMCIVFWAPARAEMALDQEGRQIGDAGPAGAGDPVAVNDVELVGDRLVVGELLR